MLHKALDNSGHTPTERGSLITIWEVASSQEYRALPWSPVMSREEVRDGGGLSPDGRWLAIAAGDVFRIWDLRSGQFLATLPTTHAVAAAFHPSGTELFTSSHGGLYRWQWNTLAGLRIGPALKLQVDGLLEGTSDGKLLAVTVSPSVVQLIDVSSWRPPARLQSPDLDPVMLQGFSPEGSQLVVARAAGGAHVWNLRLIREQLQALGLDWDSAALPSDTSSADVTPLRVEVQVGSFVQLQKNWRRVNP
jgi:WD40 repeat protein